MSIGDYNHPAHGHHHHHCVPDFITRRDFFAGMYLAGRAHNNVKESADGVAVEAYKWADAFILASAPNIEEGEEG